MEAGAGVGRDALTRGRAVCAVQVISRGAGVGASLETGQSGVLSTNLREVLTEHFYIKTVITSLMGLLNTICDWGRADSSFSRVCMALVEEVGRADKLPPEANNSSTDTVTLGTPPLAPH